jgi:hypothetical protein
MSQENVELVRRIYDAWDREKSARDFIAADMEWRANMAMYGLFEMDWPCVSCGVNLTERPSKPPG